MMRKNNIKKNKFLITMIIIIVCATMVNYGLYNILNIIKPTDVYSGVQMNIISMVIIIGIVTGIMMVFIPKENVNELLSNMENNNGDKSPEQQLQDMIDEELEKKND